MKVFYDMIPRAMANFGMNFNSGEALQEPLEEAGFVNISRKVLKIPFGSWPKAGSPIAPVLTSRPGSRN